MELIKSKIESYKLREMNMRNGICKGKLTLGI